MRVIFFILLLVCSRNVNSQTAYYMANNGDDANPGTIGSPRKSIEASILLLSAGDTLYIRGGTHRSDKGTGTVNRFYIENLTGTSTDKIVIRNYPGESPVFNMDEQLIPGTAGDGPVGWKVVNCSHIQIIGIRITGLAQNPANINSPAGMILYDVDSSTIERVEIDNIQGYGLYLQGDVPPPSGNGCDSVTLRNVDAHHLGDRYSGWGGANGFNITGGDYSTNILFEGCRAWWCSDDGFDLYSVDANVRFKDCWAFWNGYIPGTDSTAGDGMGFKLGPNNTDQSGVVLRRLENCLAFENRRFGFDQNVSGAPTTQYQVWNCVAYDNKDNQSFFFGGNTGIAQNFKNNIALLPSTVNGTEIESGANVSNNTWNGGVTCTSADFVSVSSVGMDGARGSDGSLPVTNFLRLADGSDLIDAGVNVGIPYNGSAPDIGAFEKSATQVSRKMSLIFL